VVETVRAAVGDSFELMVDANQGWRMPGDRSARWDVATAAAAARELERIGVYWLEEPLRTDDYDGYRALRRRTDLRLAAGEMVREAQQARDLVVRGGIDVLQCDCVLAAGGMGGVRRLAALADAFGRTWSPHTWSNGYGLLANLHLALAVSTCPYLEVPLDEPGWTAARRDWLLPAPLELAADGTIAPPDGAGLGVVPDFDALEQYRVT
jgi:L-alanine-DL-glutamate epimerase-like enolase superfamily enzyme